MFANRKESSGIELDFDFESNKTYFQYCIVIIMKNIVCHICLNDHLEMFEAALYIASDSLLNV